MRDMNLYPAVNADYQVMVDMFTMQVYLSIFEMANLLTCFVINFYCLCVAVAVKELHALDYYIVLLQTFFDCFFVGLVGLMYKILDIVGRISMICGIVKFSALNRADLSAPVFAECGPSSDLSREDSLLVVLHNRYHYLLSQIFKGFIYSASMTILALTIERYLLIVHPQLSDKIKERHNRLRFYFLVTCCTLVMPAARVSDFISRHNSETMVHKWNYFGGLNIDST
ncbi:uncharacterized protein LOC142340453 [Convolutriloba macropyga]|uniref:uncharacterized protein LOC142340453 n=1 Tax=Convolutriloba macropyga TaxID=536237 RepID=UPI003F5264C3